MTVFWILLAVALVGGLFLAWRSDRQTKTRRAALQGQTPGQIQDVRGDVNITNVRGDQAGGGIFTP